MYSVRNLSLKREEERTFYFYVYDIISYKICNIILLRFVLDDIIVGWVRIREVEDRVYKISSLCVLPDYQNRGIAQTALNQIENDHPHAEKWILNTILQESGNCHLYERLGYVRVGESQQINEKMTIIDYEKIHQEKTQNQ